MEKVALKVVEGEALPITVSRQNLAQYLGTSFHRLKDHTQLEVGMAISLGGGEHYSRLTYIESFRKSFLTGAEQKRGVMFTGSLGNVFKEAMNISYTFIRKFLA